MAPVRKNTVSTRLALPSGGAVDMSVRRSQRARRILLHVDSVMGGVELVLPGWTPVAEGLDFARSKSAWIESRLSKATGPIPFAEGLEIPVLGNALKVRFLEGALNAVDRSGNEILVSGRSADLPGLVRNWLRHQAGLEIRLRVAEKTEKLGRRHNRIAIRDPRTLWGSCSHNGNLSFSWRLILAPPRVLDYVVAHEVAHLAEMNHGPRFWAAVGRLCDDPAPSRAWLRRNGRGLHRYG